LSKPDGADAFPAAAAAIAGNRAAVQPIASDYDPGRRRLSRIALRRGCASVDQVIRQGKSLYGPEPYVQQAVCARLETRLYRHARRSARSGPAPKGESRLRLLEPGAAHRA